ncbi:MAG: hypothetical protein WC916_01545 [Candidatus Woesearchaeota archaeon]
MVKKEEITNVALTAAAPEVAMEKEMLEALKKEEEAEKKTNKDKGEHDDKLEEKKEEHDKSEDKKKESDDKKNRKEIDRTRTSLSQSNPVFHTMHENGLGLFVFLAILAHIVDAFTSFTPYSFIVILIYGIILLVAGFSSKGRISNLPEFFIVAALSYGLPRIMIFFQDSPWKMVIAGIVLLAPIMPIYLSLKMPVESKWRKFVVFYIIFWCIIALIWALTQFNAPTGKALINNPLQIIKYVGTGVGKTLSGGMAAMSKSVKIAIAQATGQRYEGEQENERGIFLENLRPIDTQFYTDSNVFVEARIRAKNVPGVIKIKNICVIPEQRKGIATPETVELANNDENTIDCELGKIGKEGSYEVKFISTFLFETDADITYTFMDRKRYQSLDTENTGNINSKLGITDIAIAKYTGGPVELGLPSLHQPLKIDIRDPNNVQYPFGISLMNMWPRGTIVHGISYTLEVPESVELEKCTRKIASTTQVDGMNIYTFNIDDAGAQEAFDSVTCRIKIVDLESLLGGALYTQKTFSAKAVYEYAIEESTYIVVQQWFGDQLRQNDAIIS